MICDIIVKGELSMSEKKKFVIKYSIVFLIVSSILSWVSAFISGVYNMNILYTTILSFTISWIITLIIPANKINNKVASLFNIKPNTILSGAVGGLVNNLYFCPTLTMAAVTFVHFPDMNMAIKDFFSSVGIMYVVSYISMQVFLNLVGYIMDKIDKKVC